MKVRKIFLSFLVVGLSLGMALLPVSVSLAEGKNTRTEADSGQAAKPAETEADIVQAVKPVETEADPVQAVKPTEASSDTNAFGKGAKVSGSFAAISGKDIATIRYLYTGSDGEEDYAFAEFTKNADGSYSYSFTAPEDGFNPVSGSNVNEKAGANVIAEYYSLSKWDGAVDVSWYDETSKSFNLYYPAQLAGFAAIVNGSVDGEIHDYQVKGYRSHPEDRTYNRGLPDYIESDFFETTNLVAGVKGCAYKGVMKHDFADRTVYLMNDMDMGGVPGNQIEMGEYDISTDNPDSNWNRKKYDYPNWTPIGGEYLMDVTDADSMIIAFFNGTLDGNGHYINNLYCYRWSYRTVGDTAYGYSQGVGLIGDMGTLYDDARGTEENPKTLPAIRNLGLSGYVYGRRMVGGFVGCIGGGSNAADGTSVSGGICLENLVNHAYVYCTDSKGLGGIVGTSMAAGSIINCYNDGKLCANYAAPTGGIIGSNEGMDIFCCYNRGSVYAMQTRGRGIGSDNSGSNYTVDNCYYLENCGNDPTYPGYYTYNLPKSVKVNVTEMSDSQMKGSALLNGLNTNGLAYVAGDDGYPVLYWEKQSGTGNLTLDTSCDGGTLTASKSGSLPNGSVIYLENEAFTGFNFRCYTLNGEAMTGDYVTVNGASTVSAVFESAKAGVLKIAANAVVRISVTKNGTIIDEQGQAKAVSDYPVKEGDSIFEGDVLIVEAHIKDGCVPADEGLSYRESVGMENPYEYHYQYSGKDMVSTNLVTFTVGSEINEEGVALELSVVPLTTEKLWKHMGDTSWYDSSKSEFVITTAKQLAGLALLVEEGESFAGKTLKLGNDISMENPDGTAGKRYWDGIGSPAATDSTIKVFSGTFDGQGYSITDLSGNKNALFTYAYGSSATEKAVIRNLSVYGTVKGIGASGIVYDGRYLEISNCNSYCALKGTSSYSGGIIGYARAGCSVTGCVNYGNISSVGKVGGIAGELAANAELHACMNKGDISVVSFDGNSVGGVVGSLSGKIETCANYGNILAYGRNIGGIAGQSVSSGSEIKDCYNVGTVTYEMGSNSYDCIGGMIGYASYFKVYNSFNYGLVTAKASTSYSGAVFGREGKRSSSVSSKAYYLDTTNSYAENNTAFEELPQLSYCAGIVKADAALFAGAEGVLASINGNQSFVLVNGKYPEFSYVAGSHAHTGGNAFCTQKAVCEVCGLEYGETDPQKHESVVLRRKTEAAWTTDGYSGDMECRECGTVTEKGTVIKADTDMEALTVIVVSGDSEKLRKTYSVAEFDALKTVSKGIAYQYGGKSSEIMVATEYVPVEKLLKECGYEYGQLEKIKILYAGNTSTVSGDILRNCNKYYDAEDVEYAAPAAICMKYTSLAGTLEEVAKEAVPTNALRFGYGISEEQHAENTSLGGKRLISPVNEVTLYISNEDQAGITLSGSITGYLGQALVRAELFEEGKTEASYSVTGKESYEIANVKAGSYTLRISADGLYVEHEYEVTVTDSDQSLNVTIYQLGDVDMNGKITAVDSTLIIKHIAKVKRINDPYVLKLADTDRNGSVTTSDSTRLSKYLARILKEL